MSAILKNLIEKELKGEFGDNLYSGEMEKFAKAIASAMQQYITANVITNPGQVVTTAGGPTNQVGSTTSPGTVTAQ